MASVAHDTSADAVRGIGTVGAIARASLGVFMAGSVVLGHVRGDFNPLPFVLGLVVFPGAVLGWQRRRVLRNPERLVATGAVGHALTAVVFLALYFTWWYAPALSALSDAALLFYGTSMLAAAARGYRGCEVLAISNWILRRDDQVGCLLFQPLDRAEQQRRGNDEASERSGGPAAAHVAAELHGR